MIASRNSRSWPAALLPALLLPAILLPIGSAAGDELARGNVWERPPHETVREQALAWLAEQDVAEHLLEEAAAIWSFAPEAEQAAAEAVPATVTLDCLVQTLAMGEPRVEDILAYCARPASDYHPPEFEWLRQETDLAPLLTNNVRLYYARWLSQNRYYDESLIQIADLEHAEVVDPATLLFLKGLNGHRLLNKELGLKALGELLRNTGQLPRRYEILAGLMQSDLENIEEESLNHISRQMEDVKRRLALGRAGKTVQIPEEELLDNLDNLIEQLEQQRQQQQQSGSSDNIQSSAPAPDSTPMGGTGPGEVDRRELEMGDSWGNLPPQEREKTLQDIGRDFPSHYREAIEEFFRQQARLRGD